MNTNQSGGIKAANFYELLQVRPGADLEVIEAAFRARMRTLRLAGSTVPSDIELAQRLAEAHRTLTDPNTRNCYDESLKVPDPRSVGSYRIVERIAESGNCYVYRGEHELNGEPACIKHCYLLTAAAQEGLLRESRTLAALRHFCLPVFRDVVRMADGSHAVIMSFASGATLEDYVRTSGGKISPIEAAWIVDRVLNALLNLAHVHQKVHCDLNPKNVIIEPKKHGLTLVGFGHAVSAGQVAQSRNDLFSSPEQLAGEAVFTEADLFSLGWLSVFMLGGTVSLKRREIPGDTPPAMARFIGRLIDPDPDQRASWGQENLCETWSQVRLSSFGFVNTSIGPDGQTEEV